MKELVILDASGLMHQAHFSHKSSVDYVKSIIDTVVGDDDDFIVAIDSKNNNASRKAISKNYKKNRQPKDEKLVSDLEEMKKMLIDKYECYESSENEADDVVATIAWEKADKYNHIYIITLDKDLGQLISENISIVSLNPKHRLKLITIDNFPQYFKGLSSPSLLVDMLAIAGDTADNIVGVLPENKAIELLNRFGGYREILKNKIYINPKTFFKLENNKELIEKNIELAKLKKVKLKKVESK